MTPLNILDGAERKPRRIEIDFHQIRISMADLMKEIERLQSENPDRDYFMDGDKFAIVSVSKSTSGVE